MDIYLRAGNGFFVPSIVADHLLGIASHDQLKVLLYVLAHPDTALTADAIASACKVRPENTEEALSFWQDANVLTVNRGLPAVSLTEAAPDNPTAEQPPVPAQSAEEPAAKPKRAKKPPQTDSSRFKLNPGEIAERTNSNPDIRDMFQGIESFAGTLKPTQMQSCIWMNEVLGLAPQVILMLCHYCHTVGHFAPRYWELIAQDWSDRGINTYTLAEQDIDRRQKSHTYTGRLKRIFGMKPELDPTPNQQELFDSWQQAGFSEDLVAYAFERCRDKGNVESPFSYVDGILKSWTQKGITTVEAAKLEGAEFAAAQKTKRSGSAAPSASPKQPADVRIDGEPSINMDTIKGFINQF
ncbi:MAG: DnaD domain protein [Oscillospiraceae bacterium]|nr:DnaD domain protein [Oscillospiraceae bacterium]